MEGELAESPTGRKDAPWRVLELVAKRYGLTPSQVGDMPYDEFLLNLATAQRGESEDVKRIADTAASNPLAAMMMSAKR